MSAVVAIGVISEFSIQFVLRYVHVVVDVVRKSKHRFFPCTCTSTSTCTSNSSTGSTRCRVVLRFVCQHSSHRELLDHRAGHCVSVSSLDEMLSIGLHVGTQMIQRLAASHVGMHAGLPRALRCARRTRRRPYNPCQRYHETTPSSSLHFATVESGSSDKHSFVVVVAVLSIILQYFELVLPFYIVLPPSKQLVRFSPMCG